MIERIAAAYARLATSVAIARTRLDRPLTLAEKIFFGHFVDPQNQPLGRGVDQAELAPDRVALQDATAQMALLQFELAGLQRVAAPTTVHCDHLIQAQVGADADLARAVDENEEVYTFLSSAAARYGAGFWKPGSGIIHQVVFENYAFPGGMMIGTDSHTPNAGGLGMIAIGVGGADAVDVMAGIGWGVTMPRLIGVYLTGELDGWSSPKDVIIRVAAELTVRGGTGAIVEYFGPGVASLSATGRGTITNMGAEIGATTSLFPFDERTAAYLESTERSEIAQLARDHAEHLRADDGVEDARHEIFDRVLEIDLSTLQPAWVGPHTPDLRNTVAEIGDFMTEQSYPKHVTNALIGSCTNSSYEDISRAAHIARQAAEAGLELRAPLLVTPGSEQIRATTERDGQLATFEQAGATVLANACGPCIGQWKREDVEGDEQNTIVTSFNRNFPGRNDANRNTLAFIGSPELVVATAFAGSIDFDPRTDTITQDGREFRFVPPTGDELPPNGFDSGESGYIAPPEDGSDIEVIVVPESNRLERLTPFPRLGRAGLQRALAAAQDAGQDDDGPHLAGRVVAALPRAPGQHLRESLRRRRERVQRRDRHDAEPAQRRGRPADQRGGARLQGGRRALAGRGRRELRRGIEPRARRDGAASPRRTGRGRALVRADRRDQPQEAGPAGADVQRPRALRPGRADGPSVGAGPGRARAGPSA